MTDQLSPREFQAAAGTEDWRVLVDGAAACFRTATLDASARFVAAIAADPELAAHPPSIDIRSDGVTIRTLTASDDGFGMTGRDVAVARAVSAVARDHGLSADPSALSSHIIVIGSPEPASVMPFWEAVLGYRRRPDSPDEDLVDPAERGTAVWFEAMDEPRGDGGGAIHLGVFVPDEVAEARVAAALAAGGRLVRDHGPAWWTLADAAGNEADIASALPRG